MHFLEWGIFIALIIVIVLIIISLLKKNVTSTSEKINTLLKEQFLDFQTRIHNELNTTRQEVSQSKDIISKNTIKTLETIKDMGDIINKITHQQEEAQKFGQSLKDLLQAPKLRGNYGETILEEMLERVLPKDIWESQYTIDEQKQVDAVVKMKGIVIPIDAKFSRDNYQRYLEASSLEEKEKYWKAHEMDMKKQVKEISSKYIKPEKGTSDFALMFIPSEAIYYETIAEKNYLGNPSKIYEYCQQNKVIPVSPNTFYAFLQVIVIGIRNLEIIKSAKKLQEGLSAIQKSFDFFHKHYMNIGDHIEKTVKAYHLGEEHINRYKSRLDSTLQIKEIKNEIESLPESEVEE
ncbi:MAG: DNA recombination protein RmuC [Candidatus Aminicenantes bacterium]|nr:DNA recombination protein RmuC [Candidatus Aminicenantes bacterium]